MILTLPVYNKFHKCVCLSVTNTFKPQLAIDRCLFNLQSDAGAGVVSAATCKTPLPATFLSAAVDQALAYSI